MVLHWWNVIFYRHVWPDVGFNIGYGTTGLFLLVAIARWLVEVLMGIPVAGTFPMVNIILFL